MLKVKNKFGEGILYNVYCDLKGKIYCRSCACMSVNADYLSWSNLFVYRNDENFVKDPNNADNIIILSCQVTDLAILNDIHHLESLMDKYPDKNFFVGGCLAKRFDIQLPDDVKRLDNIRVDNIPIVNRNMIDYVHPFWVKNFKEDDSIISDGHLFRNSYPLRIGVGCSNNCTYCTIRHTRGYFYQLLPSNHKINHEFSKFDDILLIADSPTKDQIIDWSKIAFKKDKLISIRNVEPFVITEIFKSNEKNYLDRIIDNNLLNVLHCPIQHTNPNVLKDMERNVESTLYFINEICPELKKRDVFLATNIITDYKNFPDPTPTELEVFDYVSWNPYWDSIWDIDKAKERWNHYFPWNKIY